MTQESKISARPGRTRDLLAYFFGAYKGRSVLMVILMLLAGFAEGVGVITLVPVLEFAGSAGPSQDGVSEVIFRALGTVGLEPSLGVLLILIVLLISTKALFLVIAQRQVGFIVAEVTRDLRLQVLGALMEVQWRFFRRRSVGQFVNSVMSETVRSAAAYIESCRLVAGGLQTLAYLVVAMLISWQISAVAVVAGFGLLLLGSPFIEQSRVAGRQTTRGDKALSSRLIDVLGGIKALRAMDRQKLVRPLLERDTEVLKEAKFKQVSADQFRQAFQEPVITVLLASGLFVTLSTTDRALSSLLVLAFVFYRIMLQVGTLQMRYQVVVVGESAFFSLWDELRDARTNREEEGRCIEFRRLESGIRLEEVSYSHGDHPVLDRVDFELRAGSFVAISGESGAGKTTLADLLVGLYQPDEGRILVDGVQLSEYEIASWRQNIGYVPQEMLLFNDTILGNVTLGDPNFTREDAERALRMAGAWEFVGDKPDGLDHEIGEGGGMLSGGQRQRLAIARALVGRPALLILDEGTTALDPETERDICATLRSLSGQVTILAISHQPAIRSAADHAFELLGGRLVSLEPVL